MANVDIQTDSHCGACGKPFQKRGSMTQWIFDTTSCKCRAAAPPKSEKTEATINFCAICGLPVRTKTGSLTHWIFKTHACECLVTDENSEDLDTQELPDDDIIEGAPYEFLGVTGSGGVATVYKAKSRKLGRFVAVKILQPGINQERAGETFLREARAASKLNHPNVVTIQDYGETKNGRQYLVTEWIEGITLGQYVNRKGMLPVATAQEVFAQVLDGLSHAHNRGVIHRDIKPNNIMLARGNGGGWTVKIIDFGTAKEVDNEGEATRAEDLACSPLYMSPEQATGEKVDFRSDLYSVGCSLFEVLTGRTPFVGRSLSVVMRHQLEDPPSLKQASGGAIFPHGMEVCVAKLLSKEPTRRYQSAEEAKEALYSKASRKQRRTRTRTFEFLVPSSIQQYAVTAAAPKKFPWQLLAGVLAIVAIGAAFIAPLVPQSGLGGVQTKPPTVPNTPSPFQKNSGTRYSDTWSDASGKEHELSPDQPLSALDAKVVSGLSLGHGYTIKQSGTEAIDEASKNYAQHRLDGIEKFRHLRHLVVLSVPVSEDAVAKIATLSDLATLTFGDTHVPKKTISLLSALTKLRSLEVEGASLTPLPLDGISNLRNLTWLSFDDTAIGDAVEMTALEKLDTLSLIRSQITDKGLSRISRIPNLHTLIVHENKSISINGCRSIIQSPSITSLIVGYSHFGDDGVKVLSQSQTISALDLTRGLGITDKSVPFLIGMKELHKVDLTGTDISEASIEKLRAAKENLEVKYTPNILEIQEVLPSDKDLDLNNDR